MYDSPLNLHTYIHKNMHTYIPDPSSKGFSEPTDDEKDLLDPSDAEFKKYFRQNYARGSGTVFGPAATKLFLRRNNLELLVRSHEVYTTQCCIYCRCMYVCMYVCMHVEMWYTILLKTRASTIVVDLDIVQTFTKYISSINYPDCEYVCMYVCSVYMYVCKICMSTTATLYNDCKI